MVFLLPGAMFSVLFKCFRCRKPHPAGRVAFLLPGAKLRDEIRESVNLRTNIMDFTGFDSSRITLNLKGWNSKAHREVPGKLESSSLSLSRDKS